MAKKLGAGQWQVQLLNLSVYELWGLGKLAASLSFPIYH